MADKRIYELNPIDTIASTDCIPVDNANRQEAVKLPINTFKTMLTQAQYDALPSSKNTDGIIYYITDNNKIMLNGNAYGGGGDVVELTQAQYDALPSSKLTDGILYCITDATASASDVPYDNTESGLEAEEVQSAIDELQDTKANSDDLAPVATSGSYNDLDDKPTFDAEAISYDNTASGLEADNVQDAIDETITKLSAVGTASGDIATFSDGSNLPMPKLEVSIEPVQDLHGYDAPWVGGAGKNKLDNSKKFFGNNKIYVGTNVADGLCCSLSAGTYTISAKQTISNMNIYVVDKTTGNYIEGFPKYGQPQNASATFTLAENKDLIVFFYNENFTNENNIYDVQIEVGNQATSYQPYSNICPIIGWDECNVTRTGKNLLDISSIVIGEGVSSTGAFSYASGDYARTGFIRVKPNTTYYYSNLGNVVGWFGKHGAEYSSNDVNTFTQPIGAGGTSSDSFTTSATTNYVVFNLLSNSTQAQLEEGNEPTTYEPYNGHTYTIDLNGTRYGGKVDLVSGVMTVDRAYVDLGTLNWLYSSGTQRMYSTGIQATVKPPTSSTTEANIMCSIYATDTDAHTASHFADATIAVGENKILYVYDTRFSDAEAFKTAMNGVQLVYELATPLTIQLSPTPVISLDGENNVSADSGAILDAEYIRDLTTIIDYILEQFNS